MESHGKSRNGHGKITEVDLVTSVGTLNKLRIFQSLNSGPLRKGGMLLLMLESPR